MIEFRCNYINWSTSNVIKVECFSKILFSTVYLIQILAIYMEQVQERVHIYILYAYFVVAITDIELDALCP